MILRDQSRYTQRSGAEDNQSDLLVFEDTRIRQLVEGTTVVLPLKSILPENFMIDGSYELTKDTPYVDYNITISTQDFVTELASHFLEIYPRSRKNPNTINTDDDFLSRLGSKNADPPKIVAARGLSLGYPLAQDYLVVITDDLLVVFSIKTVDQVKRSLE